jgi:hypothetical protein
MVSLQIKQTKNMMSDKEINKRISGIAVNVGMIKNIDDLINSFYDGTHMLYAAVHDGFTKDTLSPRENWIAALVPVFYLFRHVLELTIKSLIKEIGGGDISGHDIKTLWEKHLHNVKKHSFEIKTNEKINEAFEVLGKFHLLKDEELFRYFKHKNGRTMETLLSITTNDCEILISAIEEILRAIEQIKYNSGAVQELVDPLGLEPRTKGL